MAKGDDVVEVLASVAAYGGQLAAVFHNYSLTAKRIQRGSEGAINILDATVATLKQVSKLFTDDVDHGKNLFSQQGVEYARLLAVECGTAFAGIEPIMEEAYLDPRERRALRRKRKSKPELVVPAPDPMKLRLDEKKFLETVERAIWSRAFLDIEKCTERLHDLQLHLLLVFQVVTVHALSKDVSFGRVDVPSIVSYHDRIKRTAELIGITTRTVRNRRRSFSDYDSFATSSDSDSSDSDDSESGRVSSTAPRSRKKFYFPPVPSAPPPPRPSSWQTGTTVDVPGNSVAPANVGLAMGPPGPPPMLPPFPIPLAPPAQQVDFNPPAYIEKRLSTPGSTLNPVVPVAGTMAGVAPEAPRLTPLSTVSPTSFRSEKQTHPSVYPSEKPPIKENENLEPKKCVKSSTHEARLFKNPSNGNLFRFKSIFRSKESLAAEMRRTLSDTESRLIAFIIQGHTLREVPHSIFHSLETTHMKTILSQLHDDTWYQTFSTLDIKEHSCLRRVLYHLSEGRVHEREIVVLKVVEEDKLNVGTTLLNGLRLSQQSLDEAGGRRLLAIVREKLADGKPLTRELPWHPLPPPHSVFPPGKSTPARRDHEIGQILTTFAEYTIRFREPPANAALVWPRVVTAREYSDPYFLQQRIYDFQRHGGSVITTKLLLNQEQNDHVRRLMEDIKQSERDIRFDWCWVEISLHSEHGEIMDPTPRGAGNIAGKATIIHLIAKRMLKPTFNPLEVYNSLSSDPVIGQSAVPPGVRLPATAPLPSQPPGSYFKSVPCPPGGNTIYHVARTKRRPVCHSDDTSDSDSSRSSSDSAGAVRRRLRRVRKNRLARSRRSKRASNHSDSDSSLEEDYDDVITIKVQLKKGDDVVTKLLGIWTPAFYHKETTAV